MPPSGAGRAKTPFDLGVIEAGLSRVIRRFSQWRLRSSTLIRVFGKDHPEDFALSADEKPEHLSLSATSEARFASVCPCHSRSHRARVRVQGSLGLPRRLACPTRQNLRSLLTPRRDPTLGWFSRSSL